MLNATHALTTVALLAIGGAVFYFKDNPLAVPAWVQSRIEGRLAELVPEARVAIGDMDIVLDEGWRPRLRLRDVALRRPNGAELARFNEMQAVFAARPLLDGRIQPRSISVSGIVVSLRRAADGSVALRSGVSGPAAERQAATLPALIGQVDGLLERPDLRRLDRVELRALTLRYEDVASDRAWTVDGGRIQMRRDGPDLTLTADLAVLGGGAGVATLSANYASRIGDTASTFGVQIEDVPAQDIAAQGPAFAWLGVLRAPISGSVRSGLAETGALRPIAATLQIGSGNVQPNPAAEPIPFDEARSYFSYDPVERVLQFDELAVRSKWITGQATGTASLGINAETGRLDDLIGQISLAGLVANPSDLYAAPVKLQGADADFRLRLDPFEVTLGQGLIRDQGQVAQFQGKIAAGDTGWRLAVDGRLDRITPERLLALWPERAVPNTRKWLDTNLKAGDIRNVDVALRRAPDKDPQTYLAFDFADTTVKFAKTLPPVTAGRGHFSLAENRLVISLDDGLVTPPEGGAITMTGSSFIIPDVTAKGDTGTPSVVRLETRSSIQAALSLLNMPPLSVMDKASMPVALAEGEAVLSGTLALPLKPGTRPRVAFHAEGDLLGITSDVLVRDRRIEAERLALSVDNDALSLTGAGEIDGVPFDMTFAQPLGPAAGPSRLSGDVVLSGPALETFGVSLPDGSVRGQGVAQVDITLPRGAPPELDLRSDLRGVRVSVPQVSWTKGPDQQGNLRVSGLLGEVPQIDRLEIGGPGLTARGSVSFNADRTLERVRFETLEVGGWIDAALDLVGRGAGRSLQVALRGGRLDLRNAAFGQGGAAEDAPPMEVALDRLQINDTIALTNMRGRFATVGGLDGSFQALLNGEAAVEGRVVPQGGRSAVRLISSDAGDVFRAAGLLRQVVGGDLSLVLLPVGSGGAFDGRLTVRGVTIRDAPGIAALLNAVSVVGLINELNGDGIYFEDVEAQFRLTANQLTLTEASAVGASMGLSMDGTYALDTATLAMHGVISPVYLLNGIGSLFTRRGEGLIGFNYTLTGPAKQPNVAVNPLSALTPAMFREIFRAPPPELPVVDGVSESTLPDVAPAPQRPVARRHEGR